MRLVEGMRVGLGLEEGVTCVAVIRAVQDDVIHVELLDQVEYRHRSDDEIVVFVPDAEGLHYWQAVAALPPEADRWSLTLVGLSEMVQRRQHQRYAVDLTAQIRPVRAGRRTRPSSVDVIDLSHGGVKIVGTTATETGDTVIIDLDFGRGPISATARVAMAYPDGTGRRVSHLAFTPPEDSDAALAGIDRYLRTLAPPPTA
jgi:hypothetical protein